MRGAELKPPCTTSTSGEDTGSTEVTSTVRVEEEIRLETPSTTSSSKGPLGAEFTGLTTDQETQVTMQIGAEH